MLKYSALNILFSFGLLIILSCSKNESSEELIEKVRKENMQLMEEMNRRNQYVNDVTDAINEVQDNLRLITEKERSVRFTQHDIELNSNNQEFQKNEMLSDISDIHKIIEKSKKNITDLKDKLNSNDLKIKSLETTVLNLSEMVREKEFEAINLRNEIDSLHLVVFQKEEKIKMSGNLIDRFSDSLIYQRKTFANELEQVQQGYYVDGTEDQLLDKGVLKKVGGNFLGGKTFAVNEYLSMNDLNSVNINNCSIIQLNKSFKDVVIITPHLRGSYSIENNHTIHILNKEKFWRLSRIVIVLMQN